MSAFIVDDRTINRVVTWVSKEVASREDYDVKRLAGTYRIDVMSEEWEQSLAQRMFDLNCAAVDYRYEEEEAKAFRDRNFCYQYTPCPSLPQVLKSLQCWSYQCCEGEYEKTPLYQFFTEVGHSLALKIVMDSKAYDQAKWG